jgi:hypothetical protein
MLNIAYINVPNILPDVIRARTDASLASLRSSSEDFIPLLDIQQKLFAGRDWTRTLYTS